MPGRFLEEGGSREGLDIEFGSWGHLYKLWGWWVVYLVWRIMVRKGEGLSDGLEVMCNTVMYSCGMLIV